MNNTMTNKVALITGGSSGIGKATALAFAIEGAKVVIASRNTETGERAAEEIRVAGGEVTWMQADTSQADQVETLVKRTVETYDKA